MDRSIRHFGDETPFSTWLRSKNKSGDIPSKSPGLGIIVTDIDLMVQCWHKKSTGQLIQSMFIVEVKTRNGNFTRPQESMYTAMQVFAGQRAFEKKVIRFYGCMSLTFDGTSPEDSKSILWKRFPMAVKNKIKAIPCISQMIETSISELQLIKILRFDIHPISLRPFRPETSHHGGRIKTRIVMTELGFPVEEIIKEHW